MIVALDTSSLVAYLAGQKGIDVELVDDFLDAGTLMLPPVVVAEILSDPLLPATLIGFIDRLPVLEIIPGYWKRAALLRATLIKKKRKARLGDALIAQSCIDHKVPLITRDSDFRNFCKYGDLILNIKDL